MSDWTPFSPEERERLGRLAFETWYHSQGFRAVWDEVIEPCRESWGLIASAVARDAVAGALREVLARFEPGPAFLRRPDPRTSGAEQMVREEQETGQERVLDEVRAMLATVEAPPAPPGVEES